MTKRPTRQASAIECLNTKRRIVLSCPYQLVAVEATTIDCASIILPITPPEELAAAISTGDRPSCSAVILCRLPNSTLEAVSDPVSATPSQPSSVPKKGYSTPVAAKARPSVASTPESLVSVPMASIAEIVISEIAHSLMVRPYSPIIFTGEKPIRKPEMIAAVSMPVPVKVSQVKLNTAASGVGLAATGGTLLIRLCSSGTG